MTFEKLCKMISDSFGVDADTITMDTNLIEDLGADSVDLIDMAMNLEDEFGVPEPAEEELEKLLTVGDLVRYIQSKQ